jgi:hypothetical protein
MEKIVLIENPNPILAIASILSILLAGKHGWSALCTLNRDGWNSSTDYLVTSDLSMEP